MLSDNQLPYIQKKRGIKMKIQERNKNIVITILLIVLFLLINFFGNHLIERNVIDSSQIFLLFEAATIFIVAYIGYIWIRYIEKYRIEENLESKLKFNAIISSILFIIATISFNFQLFLFESDFLLSNILGTILTLITNNYVVGFVLLYLVHSWISFISNKVKR